MFLGYDVSSFPRESCRISSQKGGGGGGGLVAGASSSDWLESPTAPVKDSVEAPIRPRAWHGGFLFVCAVLSLSGPGGF
ncbi:hypothetical protein L249_4401 [Ophiocordyceps polyrhachis-furcata BCC 54312]|uniref:Uncharacterized protein n=1 Tax=Ophiocordyceps polyrhachis-furcata BCC 54312 TaxID=1330021 RepID=A0A367L7E4_9HYPO|nr:hypothetical protein L249_4401 [Ophiocordyceps polyrhachis-furcata BCC 54312]